MNYRPIEPMLTITNAGRTNYELIHKHGIKLFFLGFADIRLFEPHLTNCRLLDVQRHDRSADVSDG